jgi:glycosyltransferase 2 family protein
VWASAVLNNVLMLWAFGIDLPLEAALLLLVGLQVGISLPTLPGTIGVFEYVCVVVLALWGVERTLAFSYGLLLHAVVMIPPMLVALLFLFLSRGACRPSSVPHH